MTLRNARPLRFSPAGVSDALAEEDAFPGACAALTNLIPDPSTKNLWTPRPASVLDTNFSGFTTPTGVTVFKVVGSLVYGMVSTARFAGYDEPFCYNIATSSFVTLTGVTSSNVPLTQATTGEWTPPTIDVMGVFVVVTHPGFDGVTNFIGWFDATNPAAPVWHAGNFSLITPILSVGITTAGTGYTNGTYTNVPVIGGSGVGATVNVTVSGGAVTVLTVSAPGIQYAVGDIFTLAAQVIGVAGSGFTGKVTGIIGSGVTAVSIVGPGTGYTNGAATGVALAGGSGSGAIATINVTGGAVNLVTITTPGGGYVIGDVLIVSGRAILTFNTGALVGGSGYTNGTYTNVSLTGGLGVGATGNITVSGGAVTACAINNGGNGYAVGDIVSSGGGIATVTLGSGVHASGQPDGVYTIGPSGPIYYTTNGTGVGAQFTVTVSGGVITSTAITAAGAGFAVNDRIIYNTAATGLQWGKSQVATISAAGPLGNGSGFTAKVATVGSTLIGSGTGFSVQVTGVSQPGGFINFTTIPSWVRQFNGRSWFGINPPTGQPSVIFSDVYALNCTNATQALQFGDNNILTAAAPLPLSNLLGGIIQSLIIFQQYTGIIQITGDATTDNLSVNTVPGGSGTASPRSVVTHPQGLLYLDHDGYRMVTMDGTVTDPIGASGAGVSVPLLNPVARTRVNAACNGSVLRVSLQNALLSGTPWQEYWFDLTRKNWSGPHTFPSIMIDGYSKDFIIAPESAPANLFISAIQPEIGESFTENGVALTWAFQTVVLMDNQQMAESEIAEMQIKVTPGADTTMVVSILTPTGSTIATTTYTFGAVTGLAARQISFSAPVVYNRMAIQATGACVSGFQIGDIYVRERALGYMQPVA